MNTYSKPSAAKQRQQLLNALREGPVNTLFARDKLSIPHVAGRVYELRALGLTISTCKEWELDSSGTRHLVAKYVLGVQHA